MKVRRGKNIFLTILIDLFSYVIIVCVLLVRNADNDLAEAGKEIEGYRAVLVDAEKRFTKSQQEGEEKAGVIKDLRRRNGEQNDQIGELTDQLAKLTPAEELELVVILDVTASQQPNIRQLRDNLKSLMDWLVLLSQSCKIGVVGIRSKVEYEFPMTEIKPYYTDGGRSQRNLLTWLDQLQTETDSVNHPAAFSKAFNMFGEPSPSTHQQVLFLSDIGCSEIDGTIGYSESDLDQANQLIRTVRNWGAVNQNRSVGTIYTGIQKKGYDLKLFQNLAHPRDENFSTNSADIFRFILNSIKPKGNTNE